MAWMIPIVASSHNRRGRTRRGGAVVGALIFLVVLGLVFFLFFNRFNGFTIPIWLIISGLGVFLIIIVGVSAVASSMSQNYVRPKENVSKEHQSNLQGQPQQSNPYIYKDSIRKRFEGNKTEVPIAEEAIYCKYCGSNIDRDARFCHQCGSKI